MVDIPGITSIPGVADALDDPNIRAKAEEESERLLEELKKSISVDVSDAGVLRKALRIRVPGKVISDFLSHNIDELRADAIVPGFRKGRAPRQLVVKRFGPEVRDSLKTLVIGQSYAAALENQKLETLGDPLIEIAGKDGSRKLMQPDEAIPEMKLPESGDFEYVCEVEIRPTFELPPLKGIEVKRPAVKITDADVDTHILNQRRIRGRYELLTDEGASESDDQVIADVTLKCDGQTVKHEDNVQLGVRPTRLDGIPLENLGEVLKGVKSGESRTVACTISDDYERADLRGKAGEFLIAVHEVKRLVPLPIDTFVQQGGHESEQELRTLVRDDLEAELDRVLDRAMRDQVLRYLLDRTPLELPEKLSARQTDRAIMRRVIELQQQGVPMADIEARIDQLRTIARNEATTELKLQFVLDKIAEEFKVEVTDEEVNDAIARIARRYGRRFDRVRDQLQQQGTLSMLSEQIRHEKVIDVLLRDANVVEAAGPESAQDVAT